MIKTIKNLFSKKEMHPIFFDKKRYEKITGEADAQLAEIKLLTERLEQLRANLPSTR